MRSSFSSAYQPPSYQRDRMPQPEDGPDQGRTGTDGQPPHPPPHDMDQPPPPHDEMGRAPPHDMDHPPPHPPPHGMGQPHSEPGKPKPPPYTRDRTKNSSCFKKLDEAFQMMRKNPTALIFFPRYFTCILL